MAITTSNSLLDALRQHRLLEPKQLDELNSLQAHFPEPKALAGELIRRDWLTPYQANQLLTGKGHELVLGSYILLERLGEGGMGQVFKARHRTLGRIAAIKLIRKERLDNPSAVKRFQREVRSAAALSHPNIVLAYDADEIAGTHLMVMEYIAGAIDLAKLVKKNGPLPVLQACEYIRQTALGLQHAYERGMVHRDIKPANLLLTDNGKTVKVLDMGLARLDDPADEDGEKSTTMTQEGAVMGTPDYIAPEQALESHTVDIRADLYSLGCAFYFLLTGRVPFPGGTLLQKLNKHQFEEPLPVEKLRPEVPPEVGKLVRKLMAKKPTDRYQTPAEAAEALAAVCGQRSGFAVEAVANALTIADAEQAKAVTETGRDTLAEALSYIEKRDDTVAFDHRPRVKVKAKSRPWLVVAAVGGPLGLIGLAFILFLVFKGAGRNLPVKEEDPLVDALRPKKTPAKVDDAWLKLVGSLPADKQAEAVAAKLKELNPEFDGNQLHKVEAGVVTEFRFLTDNVTDISPLRALTGLQELSCGGSAAGKGKLASLAPLKGMKLTKFYGGETELLDLSPLKDMKLTHVRIAATKVFDLSALKGMPLVSLDCNNTDVFDLTPLKDATIGYLHLDGTLVSNLTPLKTMKLLSLSIARTKVTDLSPLQNMKLTELSCGGTMVASLAPLKGMPLTKLTIWGTKVAGLTPLKDMKLEHLNCHNTPVSDLAPLKDMKLIGLSCPVTNVTDLSPLKGMPLKGIHCDFMPYRDTAVLRPIKTLEKINDKDVLLFWQEVDAERTAFDAWAKQVAAMKADLQVEAVKAELKKRNPDFDGKTATHKVDKAGVVTELKFLTDSVTDLSPVRALAGLRTLSCGGTYGGKKQLSDLSPLRDMKLTILHFDYSKVSDLSPLKGLKLTALSCRDTKVSDLSPLKDMMLTELNCPDTKVSDLSPLKGMKLGSLTCWQTPVSDLSPLKDMKLTNLSIGTTQVSDLTPLKDMKLTLLACDRTKVSDLSPLKDMKLTNLSCSGAKVTDLAPLRAIPLATLVCDFRPFRDAEILRSIKTLKAINGKDVTHFWKDVDAERAVFDAWVKQVAGLKADLQVEAVKAELKKRNSGFDAKIVTHKIDEAGVVTELEFVTDSVTDIAPVRALPALRVLNIAGSGPWGQKKGKLADLSPLKGMKLAHVHFSGTLVSDLSPLKGMTLMGLSCAATPVSDLAPLKDMKMGWLDCRFSKVADLSPLKDMKLTNLNCFGTPVADLSLLKGMPLTILECDFRPYRDTDLLRSITTLENINRVDAKVFWKDVEAQQAVFDAWVKGVAAMKAKEQVEAVKAELKKRNPGFDGKVTPGIDKAGVVTSLAFLTDKVTDISPVRALSGLQTLSCAGSDAGKGVLNDLSPLKGLPLETLRCDFVPNRDGEILRSIPTLRTINGQDAQEFLKSASATLPPLDLAWQPPQVPVFSRWTSPPGTKPN